MRYRLQAWRGGGALGYGTGVIVLAGDQADARAVTWSANEGAEFSAPVILRTSRGILLHLPGRHAGTAVEPAESLFRLHRGSWREVEISAWFQQLRARLPRTLAVRNGIFPDWSRMTATTLLWRAGDATCCPTGGSASMTLRLAGDQVRLVAVRRSH